MEADDQKPRSVQSDEKCYVRFVNNTEKFVEMIWIDFTGRFVRYRLLPKSDYVDINTYKTHPWFAHDYQTKDVLHIDGNFVYYPKTTREYIQERYPGRNIPENYEARVRAYITNPLHSLRHACLLAIRNRLSKEEEVDKLTLPKNLSDDLKKAVKKRNREFELQQTYINHF